MCQRDDKEFKETEMSKLFNYLITKSIQHIGSSGKIIPN